MSDDDVRLQWLREDVIRERSEKMELRRLLDEMSAELSETKCELARERTRL